MTSTGSAATPVQRILEAAESAANRLRHEHIGPGHLLIALLEMNDPVAAAMLARAEIHAGTVEEELARFSRERREIEVNLAWDTGHPDVRDSLAEIRRDIEDLRARVERLERPGGGEGNRS